MKLCVCVCVCELCAFAFAVVQVSATSSSTGTPGESPVIRPQTRSKCYYVKCFSINKQLSGSFVGKITVKSLFVTINDEA